MVSPTTEVPRCVVVDDEPHLRRVLVRLMLGEGYECRQAASGTEALALLEAEPAHVVLSDLRMPGMDGTELLRHVRERWPDTAVIMITAVADVDAAVACLSMGAMAYLSKPFHIEEVRASVRSALERRRLVIENREYQQRLEERVAEQARRLEDLFLASMESLAEVLEIKDPYTHGHSVRVAHYASAIARELGFEDGKLRDVKLGSRLHDIGKIGVREAVLNKPGPLTDEEYRHVMTHPEIGARLLAPLLRDAPSVLNIVRSHHERYDGKGIPDGIAGENIPLEARIAAVADSFDAMTSARPYRSGLSMEATLDELRRFSGIQFDPTCVAAFERVLEKGAVVV
jgi:putative nucleotidyltransferase with HDIG domain